MGGELVTDAEALSRLEALHELTLKQLNEGEAVALETTAELEKRLAVADKHLEARIYHPIGIAGYMIVKVVAQSVVQVIGTLIDLFATGDEIWENTDYCRVDFQTWAGWEGEFKSWKRGSNSRVGNPTEQSTKK